MIQVLILDLILFVKFPFRFLHMKCTLIFLFLKISAKIKFQDYNLHLIKNIKNSNYEDYLNTKKILEKFKNETCYLVIDNYHWDEKYEQKIRFLVEKIIVIDDLANRKQKFYLLN